MKQTQLEAPPDWFAAALADPGTPGEVAVAGVPIRYLTWGEETARPLVLVHGGAAHARWWSHLGPIFARHHRVVALDLSGHGDSGWRPAYAPRQWAEEILAVAGAAGGVGRPTVVGHSMGGFVTTLVAAEHGADLDGAIVLDAPVSRPDPETTEASRRGPNMFRAPKTYPDLATALDHFHLVPPQPTRNPWLLDHVARHSLREVDGGWTWKFDPQMFANRAGSDRPSAYGPKLAQAGCRLAFVTGERSAIVDEDTISYTRELVALSPAAAGGVPFVQVPEAHHHLLLDEPLATVTAIRSILAAWTPVGTPPAAVTPSAS